MPTIRIVAIAMFFISLFSLSTANAGSTSLAKVVGPLADKAREIVRDCHSHIVSTTDRGGVTPNHRNGRAVDIAGNPSCIYAHLRNWPGGVSTDYATAPGTKHVHFSYCPPRECKRPWEWGLRFIHGGKHKMKHPADTQIAQHHVEDMRNAVR